MIKKSRDPAATQSFFHWEGDTLVLNILGKPSAKQDAIGKVHGHQLKVSVTAAPRAGRATDHMVRFLAPAFGVAVADISSGLWPYECQQAAPPQISDTPAGGDWPAAIVLIGRRLSIQGSWLMGTESARPSK